MNPYESLNANLNYFFKGNKEAVRLCLDLFFVAQIWDDLIDKDREINDAEISMAFKLALVDIPKNSFYRQFFEDLNPMVMNTILQWKDSNVLEKGNIDEISKSYMLRAGIYQLFNYCAYLIGGDRWTDEIGPQMRNLYGERFLDFHKEVKKCQIQSQQ